MLKPGDPAGAEKVSEDSPIMINLYKTIMENIVTRYPEIPAVLVGRAFDTWWLLIYPAVGLMIALGIYVIRQREKKRTAALKNLAAELHLQFFPTGDASLVEALDKFHLFSQGYSKKFRNMLHGENQNTELAIFDYRYNIGDENSTTYQYSYTW